MVCADKTKLMRGLFYLLEYLLRYSPPGSTLDLQLHSTSQGHAEITIATSSCLPIGPAAENEIAAPYPCEIEIARRSFRAAGGDFVLASSKASRGVWRATLPVA